MILQDFKRHSRQRLNEMIDTNGGEWTEMASKQLVKYVVVE
jgi:hypothetical protein